MRKVLSIDEATKIVNKLLNRYGFVGVTIRPVLHNDAVFYEFYQIVRTQRSFLGFKFTTKRRAILGTYHTLEDGVIAFQNYIQKAEERLDNADMLRSLLTDSE